MEDVMNIEFHYWLTGLIAKWSGFTDEESAIIAYSSQYVDENDVGLKIKSRADNSIYTNYISQTMNILKPKRKLMRIYPVFHFIPGTPDARSTQRIDGKMHLLNTTPNSGNAREILLAAFKSPPDSRLYRIGIASHGFADSWAHQNFVGWYDYMNNVGLDFKPDIGHADAERHPDFIAHQWTDDRLVHSAIDNRQRFLAAARALFFNYCEYNHRTKEIDNRDQWEPLEKKLVRLMGKKYTGSENKYIEERNRRYRQSIPFLPEFDERQWFDDAIETDVNALPDSQNGLLSNLTLFKDNYYWREDIDKEETYWYKFQESVKDHEKIALKILSKVFKKMDIDIYKA